MSKQVLILQSYKSRPWAEWRTLCHASVRSWAATQGYGYRFIGDELFDLIPDNVRLACRDVILPMTDVGRLLWLERLLAEGWARVIWLDSDILIFNPALRIEAECVGREVWISKGLREGFRAAESVNNCMLSIEAGSKLLPRILKETFATMAGFGKPPHPRSLGPDLLRRLHKQDALPVAPDIAMASPEIISALADGCPMALAAHHSVWCGPVRAANLCVSLTRDDDQALRAAKRLLEAPSAFMPDLEPPLVERICFT